MIGTSLSPRSPSSWVWTLSRTVARAESRTRRHHSRLYTPSEPVYTDGMQTRVNAIIISSLLAASIVACGDSATVVTTVITTVDADTSTPTPSTDTEDATTTTGGVEPTSTGTTVDLTTTGPTPTTVVEPPEYCVENEDGETSAPVTCTATADTWCAEIEAFAAEHLPEPYAGIAVSNCESSGRLDPCGVCFYIANTQCQVSGPCDDTIIYECGCLARAHGMI